MSMGASHLIVGSLHEGMKNLSDFPKKSVENALEGFLEDSKAYWEIRDNLFEKDQLELAAHLVLSKKVDTIEDRTGNISQNLEGIEERFSKDFWDQFFDEEGNILAHEDQDKLTLSEITSPNYIFQLEKEIQRRKKEAEKKEYEEGLAKILNEINEQRGWIKKFFIKINPLRSVPLVIPGPFEGLRKEKGALIEQRKIQKEKKEEEKQEQERKEKVESGFDFDVYDYIEDGFLLKDLYETLIPAKKRLVIKELEAIEQAEIEKLTSGEEKKKNWFASKFSKDKKRLRVIDDWSTEVDEAFNLDKNDDTGKAIYALTEGIRTALVDAFENKKVREDFDLEYFVYQVVQDSHTAINKLKSIDLFDFALGDNKNYEFVSVRKGNKIGVKIASKRYIESIAKKINLRYCNLCNMVELEVGKCINPDHETKTITGYSQEGIIFEKNKKFWKKEYKQRPEYLSKYLHNHFLDKEKMIAPIMEFYNIEDSSLVLNGSGEVKEFPFKDFEKLKDYILNPGDYVSRVTHTNDQFQFFDKAYLDDLKIVKCKVDNCGGMKIAPKKKKDEFKDPYHEGDRHVSPSSYC
jgi:hypothetical protein